MITEDERQQLYEAARREFGEGPAATLMNRLFAMDPDRVATKDDLTELRGELQLDNARQTRQLTLTVLGVFLAQFVAMTGVLATLS